MPLVLRPQHTIEQKEAWLNEQHEIGIVGETVRAALQVVKEQQARNRIVKEYMVCEGQTPTTNGCEWWGHMLYQDMTAQQGVDQVTRRDRGNLSSLTAQDTRADHARTD